VDAGDLIVGNGATELIVLINEVLVDRIGVPVPTFGEYIEKLRDPAGAELFTLHGGCDYRLDLAEYLAWAREGGLKALLVINPGNPTGQLHSLDEMVEFLEQAADMDLVIVDESFIDFATDPVPSVLPLAGRFRNLLIVRSMSKHYGVPGLRLGFCYSRNRDMIARLRAMLRVSDWLKLRPVPDREWADRRRTSGPAADRTPDVRPGLLEQGGHGRPSRPRGIPGTRVGRPTGRGAAWRDGGGPPRTLGRDGVLALGQQIVLGVEQLHDVSAGCHHGLAA
jgi:hypothetical protein